MDGCPDRRRIVSLLKTRRDDLADDYYRHIRKVVGYIHRQLAPDERLARQERRALFLAIDAVISRARVAAPTMPASSPSCAVRIRASGRCPAPVTTDE